MNSNVLILIIVMASVTFLIRALPFIVFNGRQTPAFVDYLGKYLPYSIMGMLVVYCLKDLKLTEKPFGLPEIVAVILTAVMHVWKRNTLLSIIMGTACYMIIMRFV